MDTKANLTAVSLSAATAAVLGESKVKAELVGNKLYVMAALDVDEDFKDITSPRSGQVWLKEAAFPHTNVGGNMEAHCLKFGLVHKKGTEIFFTQTEDAHTKAVKAAYKKLFKGKELPSIEAMEQILSLIGVKVEE